MVDALQSHEHCVCKFVDVIRLSIPQDICEVQIVHQQMVLLIPGYCEIEALVARHRCAESFTLFPCDRLGAQEG